MRFALALHTDDGVKYSVTVPDLPGCFSAGDSFDEAVEMAREAIDAHCELLAEKGLDIPPPRPLAQHQADPDLAGALWVVIEVDAERYLGRAEKINISRSPPACSGASTSMRRAMARAARDFSPAPQSRRWERL